VALAAVAVVAVGCGIGGLGQPRACTAIGALNGVTVRPSPEPAQPRSRLRVEVCQDETCEVGETGLRRGSGWTDVPLADFERSFSPGPATATISILDPGGAVVRSTRTRLILDRSFPNGRDCDGENGFLNATVRLPRA